MKIKLNDHLIGFVLGIRFRANFSIEDQLGRIIDRVLYKPDAFFGPSVFPLVKGNIGDRILVNEESGDSLKFDNSNIILDIQFGHTFNISDFNSILNNFESEIINGVMKEYSIKEILRVGIIKRYLFQYEDLAKTFVDKTIGKTLGGINDINLQFSKKLPSKSSLVKKYVNDYDNAIFTIIKKADLNEIFMSLDYQSYFDPFLPTSNELKFSGFTDSSERFNENSYLPWLQTNYLRDKNE